MKVLLAIDDTPISTAAVRSVIRQFPPCDTQVRVVHADEWPRGLPPSMSFVEGPQAAEDLINAHDEERRRGQELLVDAVRELEGAHFQVQADLRTGRAEQVILAAAEEWHPDVIVVGSHGRTGVRRFLLGSVSEGVVRHATTSVQVVR